MNNSWFSPSGAVEPVNHFHALYMRLSEIHGALVEAVGKQPTMTNYPALGELLGGIAEMSTKAAQLTVYLSNIQRDFPMLWNAWCTAVKKERTE